MRVVKKDSYKGMIAEPFSKEGDTYKMLNGCRFSKFFMLRKAELVVQETIKESFPENYSAIPRSLSNGFAISVYIYVK